MCDLLSNELQLKLLQDLLDSIAERARREKAVNDSYHAVMESAQNEFRKSDEQISLQFRQVCAANVVEFEQSVKNITARFEADFEASQSEHRQVVADISSRYNPELTTIDKKHDDASWLANSLFDESASNSPKKQFEVFKKNCLDVKESMVADLENLSDLVENSELRKGKGSDPEVPPGLSSSLTELRSLFEESVLEGLESARRLESRFLKKCFSGWYPLGLFFLLGLIIFPVSLAFQNGSWELIGSLAEFDFSSVSRNSATSAGLSLVLCLILYGIFRSFSSADFRSLRQNKSDADAAYRKWITLTKTELDLRQKKFQKLHSELINERNSNLNKFDAARKNEAGKINSAKEAELQLANSEYPQRLITLEANRDAWLKQAEEIRTIHFTTATNYCEAQKRDLTRYHNEQLRQCQDRFDQDWTDLTERWRTGLDRFQSKVREINRQCSEIFPDFSSMAGNTFDLPRELPSAVPFGRFTIDLNQIENGNPQDDRLVPESTVFSIPALLPFPSDISLLLESSKDGRFDSIELLQSVMLRLLTALPPGKVRFTVFDPIGLGQSFAAFMHLADYDELLINSRIWTNAADIENRLKDITDHMETVFQTYLRNEFSSIQEYNLHAGEVAEPYHVLVMADFPQNLTDDALRRLMSIVTTGPRCGVYALLSTDSQAKLPSDFDLSDFKKSTMKLIWDRDSFRSTVPGFEWLPLKLDNPPSMEHFGKIVRAVGDQSKNIRRIEVPFTRVAPSDKNLWSSDSRYGIDVPLGRAGATKLQHLQLGKGTSQHVLVAGRTGSGKSTFLHTLITNVALHYHPDEIEFYLIDFKKGVEFKTYATHLLPHARVIAIESDREFGLSVLRQLNSILKERGDLFRQHGVQDIASFRNAHPEIVLPRLLLVIDEFQEFFVEDDMLSQDVSLLLDRLVRQGRAFGMHVLLGTQSLAGAYTLSRSTLGQIGVRIALQCSDADAHLILSENNTAARLLTSPGEAIYNDANGMVEGNHPFQIAWIPEDRRDILLKSIHELAQEKELNPEMPVVFEGNIPIDPSRNPGLKRFLDSSHRQQTATASLSAAIPKVYVGESVEIKELASVAFRRQNGSNLLLVGQSSQSALGILSTAFIELSTQIATLDLASDVPTSSLYVFDGGLSEQNENGLWNRLAEVVSPKICVTTPMDADRSMSEICAEVKRRIQNSYEPHHPIFLLIDNLGRFRNFRKKEDDFGFGSTDLDESASPGQQLAYTLREGPGVGVHTLIWCDTYNNVSRWFTSHTLKELELRIVFPMSAADSSNLIDSPIAAKLGTNRALLYLEDRGSLEKFRPYGLSTEEWLAELKKQFELAEDKLGSRS